MWSKRYLGRKKCNLGWGLRMYAKQHRFQIWPIWPKMNMRPNEGQGAVLKPAEPTPIRPRHPAFQYSSVAPVPTSFAHLMSRCELHARNMPAAVLALFLTAIKKDIQKGHGLLWNSVGTG
jgi:hypothetical protein